MYLRIIAIFALCLVLLPEPVKAQDIEQYVTLGPAEDWVKQHEPARGPFELAKDQDRTYHLIDRQMMATDAVERYFHRDVTSLHRSEAVDDLGTLRISFNPAFETVVLHHARITKPTGEVLDVTQHGEMQLYRVETDREQLIYDGRLELAFLVPQLKKGDTLDYAYTLSGRNPALGPHWQFGVTHQYSVPVQRTRDRLLVPEGVPVFLREHGGAPDPTVSTSNGFTEYAWQGENVPAEIIEDDVPNGYRAWMLTSLSSTEYWSDIGRFFAPLYDPEQFQSAQIKGIADGIRSAHPDDKKAQLRAALAFVQSELRYTAVQLGAGGFVPRDPARALSRGFGDCKDMTVLMTSILYALGIEATPLLVNTDYGAGLDDDLPRIRAFDHVVVRAKVGERHYVLDPTRGEQLGDLDHLQQGYFGKGVIVAPDSVGMITAYISQPEFYTDVVDTFDFVTEPGVILLTSKVIYARHEADHMLGWKRSVGEAEVESTFFEYFKGLYPSIETVSPLVFEVDEQNALVTITTQYRITEPWDKDVETGGRVFWASPDDLISKLPKLEDDTRKAPFAISHPVRFRHQLKYLMDRSWGYENSTNTYRTAAFDLRLEARGKPGEGTWTSTYVTKSDRIPPKNWQDSRDALAEYSDIRWVRLDRPSEDALLVRLGLENLSEDEWVMVVAGYLIALVLIHLIYIHIRAKRALDEMRSQVLYPVSTLKFVIMSLGTLGFYANYWFWQNWRWLRHVDDQDVSPFWRGLALANIWNFSLFPHIAEHEPVGRRALARLAIPLAAMYVFLNATEHFLNRDGAYPLLTPIALILTTLAVVPFQREVLRKNAENQKWVARNSRFGWQAIVTLIFWAPMLVFLGIGVWDGL